MVLDLRRGDGPHQARHYTFSALVATEKRISAEPDSVRAAIRALMKAHKALKENLNLATEVGRKRFPPSEAELIAELVRRDLPYYDPAITEAEVRAMNDFALAVGLLSDPAPPYDRVVATEFSHLWREPV
jgi:ABC-type nitrate/sulfonate/bicarbonate transport system substrate-binding protein